MVSQCLKNQTVFMLIFTIQVFMGSVAEAAVSCTSSISNKLIGLEMVSSSCSTDSSTYRTYIDTAIQCNGSEVTKYSSYGDSYMPPGSIVYMYKSMGYRVFGDEYGDHIIAVHSNFGSSSIDTIDGIALSEYDASSYHGEVFDKILYPQAVSIDADNDHYSLCNDCDDTDPDYHDECPVAHCDNSVQDGDETGIDCGGSCPNSCSWIDIDPNDFSRNTCPSPYK
jgi:hypothetical protein